MLPPCACQTAAVIWREPGTRRATSSAAIATATRVLLERDVKCAYRSIQILLTLAVQVQRPTEECFSFLLEFL